MSNYADSSRYSQVAQEAQLAHYGLPTGGVSRTQTSRPSEYKGTIPQRKPVKTGSARNQKGPYPSMTPTPSRKPVGGRRTASSSSVRPQSPPRVRSEHYAGQHKPLPPLPGAPSAFSSTPSAPSTPLPARPLAPKASSSTTSVPVQPQRPGSSSGWSFRGRKRTESNASNASNATGTSTSNKQRTRTGSFSSITETAKKTGKWISARAEIIAMGPKEREALFATPRQEDLEAKRRRGELDRPLHQKQELTRRTSDLESPSQTVGAAHYDAWKEQEASRRRIAAAYKKQHVKDCEEAARQGRHRPSTPQAAKLSPPQRRDSFTPSMNEAAETRFGVDPEANRPRPKKSDMYTAYVSKVLDPFKRKDSDASMWLSDTAPPGSMDYCDKCGKAPQKSLQDKLCEDCYRGRYFKPQLNSTVGRNKGHNPKSPEDDARGGDLYMFLPSHHRLRKVRETMYEDPGNPFDFESFEDPSLPPVEQVEDTGWETDNSETWRLPGPEIAQTSSRAERDVLSVFSDPFDLVNAHTDRETWSSFGSTRRSMSVDIGFLPIQGLIEGRRPSDVESFWPLPVPSLHIQHPSGTLFTTDTRRDSKFYDFYDDLLAEYEMERDETGINHTQQALLVRL